MSNVAMEAQSINGFQGIKQILKTLKEAENVWRNSWAVVIYHE
jgi:hypothetical protein